MPEARHDSSTDVIDVAEIRRLLKASGEVPELGDGDDESLGEELARETIPPPPAYPASVFPEAAE